ncbi:MAG: hypothetical protein AAGA48_27545 [Myxococcota bacterium]
MTATSYGLQYQPEHTASATDRMLWHQRCKPRLRAYVEALACAGQLAEDTIFSVYDGSTLLNDATVAPAIRQWGKLVGEQQGALPTPEFRRFIDLRIRANTIGTTQTPCNVANYVQLLEDAFAPASVRVAFQPNGAPLVRVTVTSGAALLAEPVAERATTVARRARPIGTLVSLHEVTETGVVYGVPGRGYSPTAWIGRSLSTGLGA